jgi:pimeloyl-ACP methyl ester carboxylesterase
MLSIDNFANFIFKISIGILLAPLCSFAEIISVHQISEGLFISSAPTLTYVYRSNNSARTLIFIPGGDGSVGVKPEWVNSRYFREYSFNLFLKRLSESDKTSGSTDVVIFDNPVKLNQGAAIYPFPRGWTDHLVRIHSVVDYYSKISNKPVWIMGHSNGAASVTEYLKWLEKEKKEIDIKGLVFSSGADGSTFPSSTKIPVLFLGHEKEGCTKYINESYSRNLYEKLKANGNTKTEYFTASGGSPDPLYPNPCFGGYHMYFGAEEQVSKVIDDFLSRYSE